MVSDPRSDTISRSRECLPANPQPTLLTGRWTPYVFMAPVILYLLFLDFIPLLNELYLSFTSTSLLSPNVHKWVGLDNYSGNVPHHGFSQFDLDHRHLHGCLRGAGDRHRPRRGAASRQPVRWPRRCTSADHAALGSSACRCRVDLHLDLQCAIRRFQLRTETAGLSGFRELARHAAALARGDL